MVAKHIVNSVNIKAGQIKTCIQLLIPFGMLHIRPVTSVLFLVFRFYSSIYLVFVTSRNMKSFLTDTGSVWKAISCLQMKASATVLDSKLLPRCESLLAEE